MGKKIEEIIDKIDASKEVLSAMPRNNQKNINIYIGKIEELEEEYQKYKKDISNRLQRRYQNATKRNLNKEKENIETRLKATGYILEILNKEKTSYEKMGIDRAIFTISRYYKENLEKINEQIKICIEKFAEIGIQITVEDFDYSIYVKQYMKIFFQELEIGNINSEVLKEKFEEIYWKCPDIILHVELNIRSIYLKKQILIDKYYEKEKIDKLKRLDVTSKDVEKTNIELKKQLIEINETDPLVIQEKFLSGKLDIKNFTKEKIESDITKILPRDIIDTLEKNEEVKNNIGKFLNSLYEYQKYIKFKFIIDDMKEYYQNKDNYKKTYTATKKEIKKLENKLEKTNKKAIGKGIFRTARKEYKLTTETKELIQEIKEKYRELDLNRFYNKIYSGLNAESTLYDVLKLANSYYVYLTSCIIKNFKNIQPEEIEIMIGELDEFLSNPYNTIINHTLITDENDLSIIIKDRYKLLNFTVGKEDLNTKNINSLILKLENIQMAINMKKANLKIEDIELLCQIKKILQLK